jgi:hypothetical protein
MALRECETMELARKELVSFLEKNSGSVCNCKWEFNLSEEVLRGNVVMKDGVLYFSAPDALGILYTVYAFAEKYLGYCFFEPGNDLFNPDLIRPLKDGELLTLPKPKLKRRGFIQEFPFNEDSCILADWMARNRLNYLLVWMKYYDNASMELKDYYRIRGIEIESGHHNFNYWVPPRKYYKEHPEFFAVIDGERIVPVVDRKKGDLLLSEQICTTNKDLRDEIVRNMVQYCRANPEVKTLSLVPNDGFGWCECGECAKFYNVNEKGDTYSVSEHVYRADRIYHDMFSYVSAELQKKLPDVSLTMAAYVNYSAPSENFTLNTGSAVHFAPYWRCVNHKLYDKDCPINSRYLDDLQKWVRVKQGGEVNIYEYLMGVNLYISLPLVFHETIFAEIDWLAENGVDGYLTQFHIPHWTAYGMNFYAMAKAAAGEDKQETVDYLFESVFGGKSSMAKRFYQKLDELVKSVGNCHVTYPRALLNRTEQGQYEELLKTAEELFSDSSSSFVAELSVWAEYLLRFKKLYDKYQESGIRTEEIDTFTAWIHSHDKTRIFVHDKVDMILGNMMSVCD